MCLVLNIRGIILYLIKCLGCLAWIYIRCYKWIIICPHSLLSPNPCLVLLPHRKLVCHLVCHGIIKPWILLIMCYFSIIFYCVCWCSYVTLLRGGLHSGTPTPC